MNAINKALVAMLLAITSLVVACSDADFAQQSAGTKNAGSNDAQGKPGTPGDGIDDLTPRGSPQPSGSPSPTPSPTVNPDPTKATTKFNFGSTTSSEVASDFLLVVDNSSSMNPYVQRVVDSFAKIPAARFGSKARIGVMTGMISKVDNFAVLNEGINPYKDIEKEPGYQALVNAEAITRFKASEAPEDYRNKYALAGCANGWLQPGEKNSNNQACLRAHLQNSFHGVGCEPNTYAVKQLMDRNVGKKFFRDGAFVHVIFVSDELNPGCNRTELIDNCPSATTLKSAIQGNTGVSGIRFHGVVRPEPTTGANLKCAYQKVINPTGGKWVDITDAAITDYSPLIETIIDSTHPAELVHKLPHIPIRIDEIRIDGVVYTGAFKVADDGTLRISGLDLSKSRVIEVDYVH